MRLERYIREEWATRTKGKYSGEVDVFVNPDKNDLAELRSKIRFIADRKKKKLYVFNYKLLHHEIFSRLGLGKYHQFPDKSPDEFFMGVAFRFEIKFYVSDSDSYDWWCDENYSDSISPENLMKLYSWVNKYINIKEYFQRCIRIRERKRRKR